MTALAWGLLAAFGSGFAWAGLDAVRKFLTEEEHPAVIATGLAIGSSVLFALALLVFPATLQFTEYIGPASVALVMSLAIQLAILQSIRLGELSRTIPLLSLTPVFTAITGWLFLDERLTLQQGSGIFLVAAGAFFLAIKSLDDLRNIFRSGSGVMLIAAACVSFGAPFDKLAVEASSPVLHGLLQSLASFAVLTVYLRWTGKLKAMKRLFSTGPAIYVAAVLGFVALALQLLAYQSVMVGIVETIKRVLGMVSALVVGSIRFGERISFWMFLGVVIMAIGVYLLRIQV